MPDAETDVHDLPEVSSIDRMHELDRACWCFPEIVEPEFDGDDTHLIHHDERGSMAQAERERSIDLQPGTKLRWRDGGTVVLARRKVEAEHRHAGLPFHPGWWLEDNRGGLADFAIDRKDSEWTVVERAADPDD